MLVSLLFAVALGSQGPPPPDPAETQTAVEPGVASAVDPVEYTSPSGECILRVAPNARRDSATVSLTRDDPARKMDLTYAPELVWTRELDFVFEEAHVTDLGVVAGFAYTGGGRDAWRDSELIACVLGIDGEVLGEHRTLRRRSRVLGEPADPKAVGSFVQPDLQRFVVRIADEKPERGNEAWWTFSLLDGSALDRLHPREGLDGHVRLRELVDVRPIRWTPLTLVQWWARGDQPGVRFAVLGADGRPVWDLALRRAYRVFPDEEDLPEIPNPDAVKADHPRAFTLRLASEGRLAHFSARERGAGAPAVAEESSASKTAWVVREEERSQYANSLLPPPLPELELVKLEEVLLGVNGRNEVYSVENFIFRGDQIEFIRCDGAGVYSAIVMRQDGTVVRRQAFPKIGAKRESVRWFPLEGSRWLVAQSSDEKRRKDRSVGLMVADTRSGTLDFYSTIAAPGIRGAATLDPVGDAEGGDVFSFAVLADVRPGRGEPYVHAFGGQRWKIRRGPNEGMPWPASLVRTSSGELALLDARADTVRYFDFLGQPLSTVELREVWPRRPRRPWGMTAGPNGRLVIRDLDEVRSIRVVDAGGGILDEILPDDYEVARSFRGRGVVRIGPQGRLWVGDENNLARLDPARETYSLRSHSGRHSLSFPGAVYVDFLGRICAQDLVTGAVHVFDHRGQALRICHPGTGILRVRRNNGLTVGHDGSIYVAQDHVLGDHFAFGPDGRWLGFRSLGSSRVLFDPRGSGRWVQNGTLKLVADDGRKLREIPRLPGGRLIEGVPAVAPNGSLAVVTDRQVALYSRDGELKDAFAVALTVLPRTLAYASRGWLVVSEDDFANVIRVKDRKVWRFALDEQPSERGVAYGFSPDGSELWAVERDRRLLHRFALNERSK